MTEPMPLELQQAIQLLFADKSLNTAGPSVYRLGIVDIKKEFRKKAMLSHPDRAELLGKSRGHLEEKFKQINHAYGLLKSEFEDKYFILRIKSVPRGASLRKPGNPFKSAPAGQPTTRSAAAGHGEDEAPFQQKSKEHFFFNGMVPKRHLRLGEYLFYRGVISWGTLINAIVWQHHARPRLGEIARDLHYLEPRDIVEILRSKSSHEPFGQAAVRLGFISPFRRFVLLGEQRRYDLPLGKFFLDHQLLNEAELKRYIQENQLHNIRCYKKFRGL